MDYASLLPSAQGILRTHWCIQPKATPDETRRLNAEAGARRRAAKNGQGAKKRPRDSTPEPVPGPTTVKRTEEVVLEDMGP